jgi:predicted N-formylglutamate amidohydrolase
MTKPEITGHPDVLNADHPEIINPDGRFPCLLVCDHASSKVPLHYGNLGLSADDLDAHIGIDIGIADVVRTIAAKLDAPAVLAPYSRLLVDCTRWINDPRCMTVESDGIAVPGNAGLGAQEVNARLDAYFWPYHRAIDSVFSHLKARTGKPLFLAIHSCTRQLGDEFRACDAGTIWHEDNRFSTALIDRLSDGTGLIIGDNQPYSGIGGTFTIDYHSWGTGIPACGIEIVNDHLTTAEGQSGWATRLAAALEDIVRHQERLWPEQDNAEHPALAPSY